MGVSTSKISQWVFSENCIAKNTCENLKFKKRTGHQYKSKILKRICFRDKEQRRKNLWSNVGGKSYTGKFLQVD